LRAARPFCEEVNLTMARFDFLRAASTRAEGTQQNEITRILGLSREAVSKMLRRLIELGLVRRERSVRDRRTYVVWPTEEGERRMRATYVRLRREQPFQSLYERVFGPRSETTVVAVQNLDATLLRTGWFIGDTSRKWFYRSKDPDCSAMT
jgi:DNA-binding MarR family transcriptional regulator